MRAISCFPSERWFHHFCLPALRFNQLFVSLWSEGTGRKAKGLGSSLLPSEALSDGEATLKPLALPKGGYGGSCLRCQQLLGLQGPPVSWLTPRSRRAEGSRGPGTGVAQEPQEEEPDLKARLINGEGHKISGPQRYYSGYVGPN